METTEERQIVIPGETILEGNEYLPSDGTYREGKQILAKRFGLVNIFEKYVKVIPVSGTYFPRRGNTVIGVVKDITMRGWLLDIGGRESAFLPVSEVPRFIQRNELRDFLDFGDTITAKIWDTGGRGIDVSIKQRGFGRIEGGMIIEINPNKVPRIIGKEGSMVKLIRNATNCNLTVGQNGKIWIHGDQIENEVKTKEIIEFVVENSSIKGLTEKVQDHIRELGLEVKEELEIIEENTHEETSSSEENTNEENNNEQPSEETSTEEKSEETE
jgi:exosome complex component RRP4